MLNPALDVVGDRWEVIAAVETAVAENLDLLVPLDKAWQPTDYLPDLEAENWGDEVERFRQTAQTISDELLVVLVTGKAAQAQDELCRQAERYERLADRMAAALEKQPPVAFSWLRDRKV